MLQSILLALIFYTLFCISTFIVFLYIKKKRGKKSASILNEKLQLEAFLESIPDFMYIKDNEHRFIKANSKNAKVFKLESADLLVGKTDHDFYPKELADKYEADELEIYKTGKSLIGTIEEGKGIDGEQIYLSTTKVPITDETGNVIGLIGIGRDVTTVINYEHQLIKLNSELQNTNRELEEKQKVIQEQKDKLELQSKKLRLTNKELEVLNTTKDKLFSIIAHDLKNPLNVVLGYSELLVNSHVKLTENKRISFAESIYYSAKILGDLLDNLLDWYWVQKDSVNVKIEKIDLIEFFNKEILIVSETAKLKDISFKTNFSELKPSFVETDRNIISTVFRNILSNAIKFSNRKGVIEILIRELPDSIDVVLSDSGVGMSEGQIKDLFILNRNDSTSGTDGEKGTGLGLVLCKEFLNKINSTISVESAVNKGSVFTVKLQQARYN